MSAVISPGQGAKRVSRLWDFCGTPEYRPNLLDGFIAETGLVYTAEPP